MVAGGWAFGMVFMATDPVTSPFTERGKWIYGILIGAFVVLIRVVNPAYPESMMLVILFMNVIAPLIDYALVKANIKRTGAPPCRRLDSTSLHDPLRRRGLRRLRAAGRGRRRSACAERQEANARLYRQKNVLLAAGLVKPGEDLSAAEIAAGSSTPTSRPAWSTSRPASRCRRASIDPKTYDQRKARNDPALSRAAPPNNAGLARLPNVGAVYFVDGRRQDVEQVVLPIEGAGMWGTLYGFIALDRDGNTVRGLTFYDQKETPGLGGEIGNPKWQALWHGRKAYDANWEPKLTVIKGNAGPPDQDPHRVDGLSGATITSNGVARLIGFWLSDDGYGPFLKRFREGARLVSVSATLFGKHERGALVAPIIANNPIGVQVLGICSALAVTTRMDKALVMGIGVTLVTAFANLAVSLVRNCTPEQHPHHRPADDHRLAGDRRRPVPQGVPVRAVARAVGVRRPDHHQLHRDGPRRGLRDAEPAVAVVPRRHRQRAGLRAGAAARRVRARAARRRQGVRLHGAAAGRTTAAGTCPTA